MTKIRWSHEVFILLCVLWCCHVVDSLGDDQLMNGHPLVKLDPVVEYLGPFKTPTLWQIPPGPVKKVLFIAIGSGTLPWDYWDRTPNCLLCRGLPEMRKIVLDALGRSYAVVLISPLNIGQAWEAWPQDSPDLVNLMSILADWKRAHGFTNTSVVALGPSAGGHALSTLGLRGTRMFDSMVLMISKGTRQAWQHVKRDFPPTLFVHCPKDRMSATDILRVMTDLRKHGTQANEVGWLEHPITPTWFSQLIPGLDPPTSRAIYDTFKEDGSILDEHDYLISDVFDWQSLLRARNVLPEDPEKPGQLLHKSAIDQELRVAYAMHSTFSRRDDVIFNWFEGDYNIRPKKKSSLILDE